MGLFDQVKKKAQEYVEKNPEQIEKISDQVIDKAGDAADKATGGKYAAQVDGAQKAADDAIGEKRGTTGDQH